MADPTFQPSWKRYEEAANNPNDAKAALKASDAFEKERALEMKTSKKARDWETSRKASIMKEKPKWVKKQRLEEHELIQNELSKFKIGGTFDHDIIPMPGYVLIKVEILQRSTNAIILPEEEEPNTGIVVKISDDIYIETGGKPGVMKCPVKVGDKVMFKKYAGAGIAGLEIRSKDKDYRLMRWSYDNATNDLLAILV